MNMQAGRYSVQIDGLRALAVGATLYGHFWDEQSLFGHVGVRLFFVISGFLITGILLREKERMGNGVGPASVLKAFYIRRILRIVPAYYMMLAILLAMDFGGVWRTMPWHALFASNIFFAIRNDYIPWPTAHFWSLSVEEQFYLLWPLAVLFLSRKALRRVAIGVVAGAVLFRAVLFSVVQDGAVLLVLPPAACDALGAGILLAIVARQGEIPPPVTRWLVRAGWGLAIALLIAVTALPTMLFEYVVAEPLSVIPMAALVAAASGGMRGPAGWLFAHPVATYLGRISYGIYVYHLLVLALFYEYAPLLGLSMPDKGPLLFLICAPLTVALAALSWHLVERPINALKSRFPYGRPDMPSGPGI